MAEARIDVPTLDVAHARERVVAVARAQGWLPSTTSGAQLRLTQPTARRSLLRLRRPRQVHALFTPTATGSRLLLVGDGLGPLVAALRHDLATSGRAGGRSAPGGVAGGTTTPRAAPWLLLDDGRAIEVAQGGVLGRDPRPQPTAGGDRLLALDDPTVSKTHLAFGPDPSGGIWLVDLRSRNGTTLVGGRGTRPCPPGVVVPVPEGGTVLAGGVRLRVVTRPRAG